MPEIGKKVHLIHPVKNSFAVQGALALYENDMLGELFTSYYYSDSSFLRSIKKISPSFYNKISSELRRRDWLVEKSKIRSYPFEEVVRIFLLKSGFNKTLKISSHQLNDWMYNSFDKRVSKASWSKVDGVYAYEDCALNIFKRAKKEHLKCFYDLPIVHYKTAKEILSEEVRLFPEFKSCLATVNEPEWKIQKKDAELKAADLIFVPSNFVKDSILNLGIEKEKIKVNIFGAPVSYFKPQPKKDKKFRALFVGGVGPRKGVHYLIQAWKELNLGDAELLLVGPDLFPHGWLAANIESTSIRYVKSVPHHLLNEYYNSADCFVFPSLVEGLALVQLEAMACGLPVISTKNAGAEDIVESGKNGFLVPIRDTKAIKEKLLVLKNDPLLVEQMGKNARETADYYTWDRYKNFMVKEINKSW